MSAASEAGVARASACDLGCRTFEWMRIGQHTDAAKRCADVVNLALSAEGTDAVGKWLAIKLEDGSSDRTLYAHQSDAVGAMWPNERRYCYIRVPRQWVTLCEAESFLRMNRLRYEAGMDVMPDPRDVKRPGAMRDVIEPLTRSAHAAMIEQMLQGTGIRR